ncbi:T9SS type A sorting domain-containing protein [Prolixibacteraceae bacterium JC049]|nr:T9SS type A sorting domain-containing protein [Prolixibacteraceae bacterium JC049]
MRHIFLASIICFLSFLSYSQEFEVDTLQFNGNTDTLINVVILGDGYTEAQLDQFAKDAQKAASSLFEESPFTNYQNYFNVFMIKVPSNVSGAADDPDELIDNYYGSTYNAYYNIQRLLVPMRSAKITNVLANNFPNYDEVVMIVNDKRYGGSGGWVATYSTHNSAIEIFLHELGHSFARLSDEYWAGDQYAQEAINMTQQTNTDILKWKNWLNYKEVGLYPHSESPTWYRPHQNCKMRYLGKDFCSVCSEGIIEKIHSKVSPLLSYSPKTTTLTPEGFPLSFRVRLIAPNPNSLKIEWRLNETLIGQKGETISIESADLNSGTNLLNVAITDTTHLLRIDNHHTIHVSTVQWDIKNTNTSIDNLLASSKIDIAIFPNPVQDILTINYKGNSPRKLKVEILDNMGRKQLSKNFNRQKAQLNISHLEKGIYVVRILSDNSILTAQKIVKT